MKNDHLSIFTFAGTSDNEVILGVSGDNIITSFAGNDTINTTFSGEDHQVMKVSFQGDRS